MNSDIGVYSMHIHNFFPFFPKGFVSPTFNLFSYYIEKFFGSYVKVMLFKAVWHFNYW